MPSSERLLVQNSVGPTASTPCPSGTRIEDVDGGLRDSATTPSRPAVGGSPDGTRASLAGSTPVRASPPTVARERSAVGACWPGLAPVDVRPRASIEERADWV